MYSPTIIRRLVAPIWLFAERGGGGNSAIPLLGLVREPVLCMESQVLQVNLGRVVRRLEDRALCTSRTPLENFRLGALPPIAYILGRQAIRARANLMDSTQLYRAAAEYAEFPVRIVGPP
jgi:hypothetical protein